MWALKIGLMTCTHTTHRIPQLQPKYSLFFFPHCTYSSFPFFLSSFSLGWKSQKEWKSNDSTLWERLLGKLSWQDLIIPCVIVLGREDWRRWIFRVGLGKSTVLLQTSEVCVHGWLWNLLVWSNKKHPWWLPHAVKTVRSVHVEPLSCRISFAWFCF